MQTYAVTYNVTLTIEVQADSTDEAERLADRELPSHCDVNCAVVCHRIAASIAPWFAIALRRQPRGRARTTRTIDMWLTTHESATEL